MAPSTPGPIRRRSLLVVTIAVVVLAALGSCSPSPEPKADEPKPKATPTAPAPAVDPIRLEAVEDSRVEISDEPDWLTSGFGAVWATSYDDLTVVRLTP